MTVISIEIPKITGTQTKRINVPAENPKQYFRRGIFIPLVDMFIEQLNSRFSKHGNVVKKLDEKIVKVEEKVVNRKMKISRNCSGRYCSGSIYDQN